MSDYLHGTEVYFLDRIDSTLERMLDEIRELVKLESEGIAIVRQANNDRIADKQLNSDNALTRLFGEMVGATQQSEALQNYFSTLNTLPLSTLAIVLTNLQELIHAEAAKRTEKPKGTNVTDAVAVSIAPE